jgi:hypothetical protein
MHFEVAAARRIHEERFGFLEQAQLNSSARESHRQSALCISGNQHSLL